MPRIVLFAWCSAAAYVDALARAGAPPCRVVTGPAADPQGELAAAAARAGAPVHTTSQPNDERLLAELAALEPDLLVVAGCPHILGPRLLGLPRLGAINVHPSLLPRYRGREPVFWALLRGEPAVGVSLHRMTEAVDAGPLLLQRQLAVGPRATSRTLTAELDRLGVELVVALVGQAATGALPAGKLPDEPGSTFPRLRPEHGLIDWAADAVQLDRLVRACDGVLAAYTFVCGMRILVLDAVAAPPSSQSAQVRAGSILRIEDGAIVAATGRGELALRRTCFVRPLQGDELARVLDLRVGDRFTHSPAF